MWIPKQIPLIENDGILAKSLDHLTQNIYELRHSQHISQARKRLFTDCQHAQILIEAKIKWNWRTHWDDSDRKSGGFFCF